MNTLMELYTEELRDLYDAENQILKALPKMVSAASASKLKTAFESHRKETEGHVRRLDQIFNSLGELPGGKTCKGMAGLLKEGEELLKEKDIDPEVLDAALIAAAQRVEHYEMAVYGTCRTWAKRLGEPVACALLQETLDEEGAADKKLTALAEPQINEAARAA